jgi:hypothetical protein
MLVNKAAVNSEDITTVEVGDQSNSLETSIRIFYRLTIMQITQKSEEMHFNFRLMFPENVQLSTL